MDGTFISVLRGAWRFSGCPLDKPGRDAILRQHYRTTVKVR
jgi:hypothetical protein